MKHLDEYRDPAAALALASAIRRRATRCWKIMEVCGGQTHGLLRHGIDEELAGAVELLHGPGCPVCVTPAALVDRAIEIARQPRAILASFGDMLRVPGSRVSLLEARSQGASVQMVYSPLDALQIAQRNRDARIVLFAVGFETTAPATALAVKQAAARGLDNFSILTAHVRVLPAMEALLARPGVEIDGFLAAGHVCTVAGFRGYHLFSATHGVPVIVTGFEPLDLLGGIHQCVAQLESGTSRVENHYARSAREEGNLPAQRLIDEVYEICDLAWRGMGRIPRGALRLRSAYREFDAERHFPAAAEATLESDVCQSGRVLSGQIKPPECPAFGRPCCPDQPLGAPMVSSEGACAAYYRYRRPTDATSTSAALASGG